MEAEDYDAAKELKRDIERIRLSTDGRPAPSRASPPLPGHGSRSPAAHPEHRAEACLIPPIDASEAPSQLMLGVNAARDGTHDEDVGIAKQHIAPQEGCVRLSRH